MLSCYPLHMLLFAEYEVSCSRLSIILDSKGRLDLKKTKRLCLEVLLTAGIGLEKTDKPEMVQSPVQAYMQSTAATSRLTLHRCARDKQGCQTLRPCLAQSSPSWCRFHATTYPFRGVICPRILDWLPSPNEAPFISQSREARHSNGYLKKEFAANQQPAL